MNILPIPELLPGTREPDLTTPPRWIEVDGDVSLVYGTRYGKFARHMLRTLYRNAHPDTLVALRGPLDSDLMRAAVLLNDLSGEPLVEALDPNSGQAQMAMLAVTFRKIFFESKTPVVRPYARVPRPSPERSLDTTVLWEPDPEVFRIAYRTIANHLAHNGELSMPEKVFPCIEEGCGGTAMVLIMAFAAEVGLDDLEIAAAILTGVANRVSQAEIVYGDIPDEGTPWVYTPGRRTLMIDSQTTPTTFELVAETYDSDFDDDDLATLMIGAAIKGEN